MRFSLPAGPMTVCRRRRQGFSFVIKAGLEGAGLRVLFAASLLYLPQLLDLGFSYLQKTTPLLHFPPTKTLPA
ncbi:hypothetical protein BDY21DRAFT_342324 [Lineolata rhizophorae]|uniref:Uncharacterized protein n=1 Tax=Lineolata rhizophorae TaxID=578093 RepID=A0A6A6P2W6_9PEZI|nr:hypothetical protein BDY21DRAFT_342324 [Lineolata rhizophorae]